MYHDRKTNPLEMKIEEKMFLLSGVQMSFRCFFNQNWAFIVTERNLMFFWKYYPSYCSTCVWHES